MTTRWPMVAAVSTWGTLVVIGLVAIWHYGATPGEDSRPPATWPSASILTKQPKHTLLVFAHPHCTCTHATLSELSRLIAQGSESLETHVLFIAPDEVGSDWHDTELVRKAREIPRVVVHLDAGRRECDRFRVRTSGTCLVYDPRGVLRFAGGLTVARGHEGTNMGSQAIRSMLEHDRANRDYTLVYGCPLFEQQDQGPAEIHSPVEVLD